MNENVAVNRIRMTIALFLTLALTSFSLGDDPIPGNRRGSRNAALDYWQGIECLLAHLPDDSTPHDVHFAYLKTLSQGHAVPLDERAATAIKKSAVALYFLHRGSRAAACEWGLAFDELGPADEQGHLAQLPYLSGACCLRARWYFEHAMEHKAAEDLLALLRLAKHMGQDGRDGARALLSQMATERQVIEIAASYLPQMDTAVADQISLLLRGAPTGEVFGNFLAVQRVQWVDWPKIFAQHARDHDGNWDAYWEKIGLRSAWRTEVGTLLHNVAKGTPDELTSLADQAEDVFKEAARWADLPTEEFRRAWRAVLKKSEEGNLIVKLAGGEVEPIRDAILVAEARRDLLRAGIVVGRNGPQMLESVKVSCGPLKYQKSQKGFELVTTRQFGGGSLKLGFGSTAARSGR
jgi:hypothetical protein